MTYGPILTKRVLILVQLAQGSTTRTALARSLGFSATIGISKEVNILLADGKITEDALFRCPHCNQDIEGIPVKKDGMLLRLTPSGDKEATTAKDALVKMMGLAQ